MIDPAAFAIGPTEEDAMDRVLGLIAVSLVAVIVTACAQQDRSASKARSGDRAPSDYSYSNPYTYYAFPSDNLATDAASRLF
jgi:hypothetical protein